MDAIKTPKNMFKFDLWSIVHVKTNLSLTMQIIERTEAGKTTVSPNGNTRTNGYNNYKCQYINPVTGNPSSWWFFEDCLVACESESEGFDWFKKVLWDKAIDKLVKEGKTPFGGEMFEMEKGEIDVASFEKDKGKFVQACKDHNDDKKDAGCKSHLEEGLAYLSKKYPMMKSALQQAVDHAKTAPEGFLRRSGFDFRLERVV